MTPSETLDRLADLAGIEEGWWDFFGTWRPVTPETKRAFLAAMGFDVADEAKTAASLVELETRPWRRAVPPVLVLDEHSPPPRIPITLPADRDGCDLSWELEEELGATHRGDVLFGALEFMEERLIDGALFRRRILALPTLPAIGYSRFRLRVGDGAVATMVIAVAPAAAFLPEPVKDGKGAWGIATQVYALRTETDWGVGTYKGLAELAGRAGALGAAAVGINPLHALFAAQPDRFSPYAPSSRRFLNTTYIDVEAIIEFKDCRKARSLFAAPGFQATLAALKARDLVDYPGVAHLQRPVLEVLFSHFQDKAGDERRRAFDDFRKAGGAGAHAFATFEALHERFSAEGRSYWRHWPAEFQHPALPAVIDFAKDNQARVDFFWWLQFIADEQLGAAQRAAHEAGMGIGLYRDLGVGIAGDGAEAWCEQDNLSLGVSVGAPPDPLAPKGQDWGLVPFNPLALYESAYAPFIGVMAANMRHAGALRLDHAMSLQRLYWVPNGAEADQGAYVRYPVLDLFRLVALESRRNRCLIIGEDLGTVPDGFRERMRSMDMFAYRVMVFERMGDRYKSPGEYDEMALSIFATHDLPSARGWWNGADIGRRARLDLYPRPDLVPHEVENRRHERRLMVAVLAGENLLPHDFPVDDDLSEAAATTFAVAANRFLDRARSRLMMVQIEDVLGQDMQMNLPGTTDQHPNWRVRYARTVTDILADPRFHTLAERLKDRRG